MTRDASEMAEPRDFACEQTSRWSDVACAGNDGGPHSRTCDVLTMAIEARDAAWTARLAAVTAERDAAREDSDRLSRHVGQLLKAIDTEDPSCAVCGTPATCVGAYEDQHDFAFACDDCCGHGNEDGQCLILRRALATAPAVLPREGTASTTSNFTLRKLAENVRDDFDCICDEDTEDSGTKDCACGGDPCWKCAALMALANDAGRSTTGEG